MTDEQRLQMITDQLILVRDNLFRGMSKSIQKLQARSINEVLELENFIRSPRPAPVQEPVALTYKEVADAMNALWGGTLEQVNIAIEMADKKLYTTPPAAQRQWVGLTDEEIKNTYFTTRADFVDYARAIEAKLKEKNT
jgi:hypothetical protein